MDSELADLLHSISLTEKERPRTPLPPGIRPTNPADSGFYLVGKVFNRRTVNPEAFARTMQMAFTLIRKVEIKNLGDNRFLFRFTDSGDYNRILSSAPWHYEHHLLLLTPLLLNQQWDKVDLVWADFHVQVRGIPFVSYTEELARIIGNRIGRYIEADLNEEGLSKDASLRIRVSIDTREPLVRLVCLDSVEGDTLTGFLSYEKLPIICEDCGRLDHAKKDCPLPVNKQKSAPTKVEYGPWLRAKPPRPLGANFKPPTRQRQTSPANQRPSSQSPKPDQDRDDPLPNQSSQLNQEVLYGGNSVHRSRDEIMQEQENLNLLSGPSSLPDISLHSPIGNPPGSTISNFTSHTGTTALVLDTDMTPVFELKEDFILPQLQRTKKRLHDEVAANLDDVEGVELDPAHPNELLKLELSRLELALDSSALERAYYIDINNYADGVQCRLTGFYGNPLCSARPESWDLLRRLHHHSSRPWLCIGDFNEVLFPHEYSSRVSRSPTQMANFRSALMDCGLQDLPFQGHIFTWSNKRRNPQTVYARLDRGTASGQWLRLYPSTTTYHLPFGGSDHAPILVRCLPHSPAADHRNPRRFRFEARWMSIPGCETTIRDAWTSSRGPPSTLQPRLSHTRISLLKWHQHQIGPLKAQIKRVETELAAIATATLTDISIAQETQLRSELDGLLMQEEMFWKQRSKVHWMAKGDRNTAYFHACASARRDLNRISVIIDSEGQQHTSTGGIHSAIIDYFSGIFSSTRPTEEMLASTTQAISAGLTDSMKARLRAPFTKEEIWPALKNMKPLSAPGPDGFPPVFFQRFWPIVQQQVSEAVLRLLNRRELEGNLNHTNIVLIPKVPQPRLVSHFRPISLCNVVYKIASKMVANRLKSILGALITEEQSAFLPGRAISDNLLMAKVLERLSFPSEFIDLIMLLISSVSYSVIINGAAVGRILPSRGIRQGDPLSPYLFILCADALSAMIREAATISPDIGIQINPLAPKISHLLFADDTVIYIRATLEALQRIRAILTAYAMASGQQINLDKSLLILSRGGDENHRHLLAESVGIPLASDLGRYLGLPSAIGKSRRAIFQSIQEKVEAKIMHWSSRMLSQAGRSVLIKAVLQVIPVYTMSCFLLPKSFLHKLMAAITRFWWSGSGSKKMHWLPREELTVNLAAGGLSFRDLLLFNRAMVAKQSWRLLSHPNSICSRLIKAKYYPHSSFLMAPLGRSPSYVWRGIHSSREVLLGGLRWRIGNGLSVDAWKDPWIPNTFAFKPTSAAPQGVGSILVKDFILSNHSGWNHTRLRQIFSPLDVKHILSIPLAKNSCPDRLIWHYTRHGEYSVKTGYQLLKGREDMLRPSSSQVNHDCILMWRALWKLQLPTRILTFGWRFAKNILPLKENLVRRRVGTDPTCPVCEMDRESWYHAFLTCPFSQAVWRLGGIPMDSVGREPLFPVDWLIARFQQLRAEQFSGLLVTLWCIWRHRMDHRHNQVTLDPLRTHHLIRYYVDSSGSAFSEQLDPPLLPPLLQQRWECPPVGFVKLNFDSGRCTPSSTGLGGLIRDDQGRCQAWFSYQLDTELDPEAGEALAARKILELALAMGFTRVIVEGDCLTVLQALADQAVTLFASLGNVLQDSLRLMEQFEACRLSHTRRQFNAAAHHLAKGQGRLY
ncbi:hypothetical protein M569_00896, partial [Genlisea aurea]